MTYAKRGTVKPYFEEHVLEETDDCIEWPFGKGSHGYGTMTTAPRTEQCVHVIACERVHGPAPTRSHEVAHSCDNKLCFNPRHLRWATRQENVDDMVERGLDNFFGLGSKGARNQ